MIKPKPIPEEDNSSVRFAVHVSSVPNLPSKIIDRDTLKSVDCIILPCPACHSNEDTEARIDPDVKTLIMFVDGNFICTMCGIFRAEEEPVSSSPLLSLLNDNNSSEEKKDEVKKKALAVAKESTIIVKTMAEIRDKLSRNYEEMIPETLKESIEKIDPKTLAIIKAIIYRDSPKTNGIINELRLTYMYKVCPKSMSDEDRLIVALDVFKKMYERYYINEGKNNHAFTLENFREYIEANRNTVSL
jgi:hypothetical protein